jgi:hypothetical protein
MNQKTIGKHPFHTIDYNYLRPPRSLIHHLNESRIIEHDQSQNFLYRNVWHNVPIPEKSQEGVRQMTKLIASNKD